MVKNNEDSLYILTSYDITGSTAFKQNNPNWVNIFYTIFEKISMCDFKSWKSIGDEIVFLHKIASLEDIISLCKKYFVNLKDFSKIANNASNGILDFKAASWLFPVYKDDSENIDMEDILIKGLDLIGINMDEGFRMSHEFACKRQYVMSFELVYILSKIYDKNIEKYGSEKPEFYYLGTEKLKGCWKDLPYPGLSVVYEHTFNFNDLSAIDIYSNKYLKVLIEQVYGNERDFYSKIKNGNNNALNHKDILRLLDKFICDYKNKFDLKKRIDKILLIFK